LLAADAVAEREARASILALLLGGDDGGVSGDEGAQKKPENGLS